MAASYNNARLQQTQREVDDVVGVMRSNVEKVLERDTKLSDLDARADNLNAASVQFYQQSNRLKKKMWWENLKMKLIIGGFVLAILIIVITILAVEFGGEEEPDSSVVQPVVNGE